MGTFCIVYLNGCDVTGDGIWWKSLTLNENANLFEHSTFVAMQSENVI